MAFWTRINLLDGVDEASLAGATTDAKAHGEPALPALGGFTEGRPEWVLLYNVVRTGQIDPAKLRRMKRADLEYLAGMEFPHPDLVEPRREGETVEAAELRHSEASKLLGNVARAKAVLQQRNLLAVTAVATSIGAIGAIVGAIVGALG